MLQMGAAYAEVIDVLRQDGGVENPARVISETVAGWVDEDKALSSARRAIQRRRILRQIRFAMDESKIGDAVRAEAILSRIDENEATDQRNQVTDDFQERLSNANEAQMSYYLENGRWPDEDGVE